MSPNFNYEDSCVIQWQHNKHFFPISKQDLDLCNMVLGINTTIFIVCCKIPKIIDPMGRQ